MPADTPHAPGELHDAREAEVAIVGGGPAGLMAAEVLSAAGVRVALFDAMPTVGRKFLLAGKGGLNLTHGEPFERLLSRYGARQPSLAPLLAAFGPDELRAWAAGLGVETFVGSSGRVFPVGLKAAPLLRAWLVRLRAAGVVLRMRHRWVGLRRAPDGLHELRFTAPQGEVTGRFRAVVLALGGASWPSLGSDGAWVPVLQGLGADLAPLRPSNCGFDIARPVADSAAWHPGWSDAFRSRFEGQALKPVTLSFSSDDGATFRQQGELLITATGVEGGLIYAVSGPARDTLQATGLAVVHLDLLPGRSADAVLAQLSRPRGSRSFANHLRARVGLTGLRAALLRELLPHASATDAPALAAALKALPLALAAPRPLAEAISTAGGVRFAGLTDGLQLHAQRGVFCAGEMLDWEAPTGGYLLTACFATGAGAARGVLDFLRGAPPEAPPASAT